MPTLITQTIEQDLKILLIADLSQLSKLLAMQLEKQLGFEVVELSLEDLSQRQVELSQQDWYRVVLFLERLPLEKIPAYLPSFVIEQGRVVMPVTTGVNGEGEQINHWQSQLQKEKSIFNKLRKNIDISSFIFYKDLVSDGVYPAKFFTSQLEKQILLDPQLELGLQVEKELVDQLIQVLIKPQLKPWLLVGQLRLSRVYLSKIRDLYERFYQLRLPVKEERAGLQTHPIFQKNNFQIKVLKNKSLVDDISQALVKAMPAPNKQKNKALSQALSGFRPPDKKELVRVWNKVSQLGEVMVKPKGVASKETPLQLENNEVSSLFGDYRQQQKQAHLQELTAQTKKGFFKLKNHRFMFMGGVGVSITALGILVLTGVFLLNLSQFNTKLVGFFESPVVGNLEKSVKRVELQLKLFNWLPFPIFPQVEESLELGKLAMKLALQQSELESSAFTVYQQIMLQDDGSSLESLKNLSQRALEVFKNSALLQAKLKSYSTDKDSAEKKELIDGFLQQVVAQEKELGQFQQLSPLLPDLLGENQKQVYAVVLQNNQELRPTGGFIQAVALLTFEQGKLVNVSTNDVYSLDQKITGTISPPGDLQKFLGEKNWYLRDANWSPDFPQTAERISWFIDKSLGVKVDGVIGINLITLEKFLAILDQVELPEYNEVLTQYNLEERMEFHSEVSVAGGDQKPDYSQVVLSHVFTQLQTLDKAQVGVYFSALVEMMDNKELLLAVFNGAIQPSIEALGWSGSLIEPTCPAILGESECVVDVIAQVEANVGINKANYYLERQVDHNITVLSNKVVHKRVVKFKNKAQTNVWPRGDYRAYTRFYLPLNAEIKNVMVDQKKAPINQLIIKQELGRKVVGVLTTTLVKSETELQLEYSLPYSQQTPFSYVFFDQKQSGARETSPRIFLSHEPDLDPVLIAPQAEVQGDVIVFNPSEDVGHMFVGVSFE